MKAILTTALALAALTACKKKEAPPEQPNYAVRFAGYTLADTIRVTVNGIKSAVYYGNASEYHLTKGDHFTIKYKPTKDSINALQVYINDATTWAFNCKCTTAIDTTF